MSFSTFFFRSVGAQVHPCAPRALREIGGLGGGAPQKKNGRLFQSFQELMQPWRSEELGVWGRSPQKKKNMLYNLKKLMYKPSIFHTSTNVRQVPIPMPGN